MTWEGLFVSLSRVRSGDHIRLLINVSGWATVRYVTGLRRNRYNDMFFQCYVNNPAKNGTLTWSYEKASRAAGRGKKNGFSGEKNKRVGSTQRSVKTRASYGGVKFLLGAGKKGEEVRLDRG